MEHLGERLSALIDGELGAAEHERALIHLAKCESCRFEADMMRRLKRRLTGLGEPEPDMDFMGRLLARPGSNGPWGASNDGGLGPGGPPGDVPFGAGPPMGSSRPLGGFPGDGARWSGTARPPGPPATPEGGSATETEPEHRERSHKRSRGRRDDSGRVGASVEDGGVAWFPGGRYAVAGLAVATALLGSAFVAGGEPGENAPVVEPRLSDYAVEHAVTGRQLPMVDPGEWTAPVWPAGIPAPAIVGEHPPYPNESTR